MTLFVCYSVNEFMLFQPGVRFPELCVRFEFVIDGEVPPGDLPGFASLPDCQRLPWLDPQIHGRGSNPCLLFNHLVGHFSERAPLLSWLSDC